MTEYIRYFSKPESIHASCEDYRAATSTDLEHDRSIRNAGKIIACPTLILWGMKSLIGKAYNVMAVWRDKVAILPTGCGLPYDHFLPEEAPNETYLAISEVLSEQNPG